MFTLKHLLKESEAIFSTKDSQASQADIDHDPKTWPFPVLLASEPSKDFHHEFLEQSQEVISFFSCLINLQILRV
jgi:hypothetical protein